MYDQLHKCSDQMFSKYQCGFPQGYNTQHWLLLMVEKWKKAFGEGGLGIALLNSLRMDLGPVH